MTETTLEIGQQTADGVYAGLTADGKQQIFAMPEDLETSILKRHLIATFNDAVARVEQLNAEKAFGHGDWEIPRLDVLHILQKNQNEGALKESFNASDKWGGSDYPNLYWSSTESRDTPSEVHFVLLSDSGEGCLHKDNFRLSCRPVRLVASPSLG